MSGSEDGNGAAALAYAHGLHDVPLLEETIGENFERIVARHGLREALVSCHQGLRFIVEAFPMTVTGKIQKFEMRGLEIAERGLTEAQTA